MSSCWRLRAWPAESSLSYNGASPLRRVRDLGVRGSGRHEEPALARPPPEFPQTGQKGKDMTSLIDRFALRSGSRRQVLRGLLGAAAAALAASLPRDITRAT